MVRDFAESAHHRVQAEVGGMQKPERSIGHGRLAGNVIHASRYTATFYPVRRSEQTAIRREMIAISYQVEPKGIEPSTYWLQKTISPC